MTGLNKKQHKKYMKEWERIYDRCGISSRIPRRYKVPDGWYDPMVFQVTGLAVAKKIHDYQKELSDEGTNFNEDIMGKMIAMLDRFRYPHYFIDRDLMKLLNMSQIADNIDMSKIRYPFDTCMFSLPIGEIRDPNDRHSFVSHLGYARTYDVQTLKQQLRNKDNADDEYRGSYYEGEVSIAWSKSLDIQDLGERKRVQREILATQEAKYGQPCRIIGGF